MTQADRVYSTASATALQSRLSNMLRSIGSYSASGEARLFNSC
jgi:hypothetical protein